MSRLCFYISCGSIREKIGMLDESKDPRVDFSHPKDPFGCPKKRDIPNNYYILGMGFRLINVSGLLGTCILTMVKSDELTCQHDSIP